MQCKSVTNSTEFDIKFTSRSSQKRDVALNAAQIRHYHLGNTLGHVAMFGHSFVYCASYSHSLVLISLFQFGLVSVRASSILAHVKGARKFSQSKFIIISFGGTSHHTATNPFCCQLRTIIHCTHEWWSVKNRTIKEILKDFNLLQTYWR